MTGRSQTTVLKVTKRSSPRGSRGGTILHLADESGRTPDCGASTDTAAGVLPIPYGTAREAYLRFVGSGATCSRCYAKAKALSEAESSDAASPQGCIHAPVACPTCTGCGSDAASET